MRDTMRDASGVGLAAPQIGESLQIAVIEDKGRIPERPHGRSIEGAPTLSRRLPSNCQSEDRVVRTGGRFFPLRLSQYPSLDGDGKEVALGSGDLPG